MPERYLKGGVIRTQEIDWQAEHRKRNELYEELKEQYASEKKRADAAEEREQQLIDVMRGILDYTNTAQAYTTAAQIHYRIRKAIRSIYGDDDHEGNR